MAEAYESTDIYLINRQPLPVSSATESERYTMTAQRVAQSDAELVHIMAVSNAGNTRMARATILSRLQ